MTNGQLDLLDALASDEAERRTWARTGQSSSYRRNWFVLLNLAGFYPVSRVQMGRVLGLSAERVRGIEARLIRRLRHYQSQRRWRAEIDALLPQLGEKLYGA